jgi:glycosyltransferase involved in cell wall biosynthesis
MVKLVVMIPAYNESEKIAGVIQNIPRKIAGIDKVEVLVMDDHSKDKTKEVSLKAGANKVFRHKQNVGLGKNFKKGLDISLKLGADIIVNIDADGQFNPKDIPTLIKPIQDEEADMVTCSRFLNPKLVKNMPGLKKWGNRRFTSLVSRITGEKFTDTQCGFRAYSKEAALRMNINGKFTYTQESFIDLVSKGMRIKEIPLEVKYFKERKSHISGKLKNYGFKSLAIIAKTTRDTQPLTFFGMPAVILFLFGFLGGLVSLVYWLIHLVTSPIQTLFSVSVFLMTFGASLGILALIADMMKSLKMNQEEILYKLKMRDLE